MRIHLVDGTYELFRHHFAMPSHRNDADQEVAATRGVLGSLLMMLEEGGVTHVLTMPWAFYHGLTDDIEKKVDGIKRYAEDIVQKMA